MVIRKNTLLSKNSQKPLKNTLITTTVEEFRLKQMDASPKYREASMCSA